MFSGIGGWSAEEEGKDDIHRATNQIWRNQEGPPDQGDQGNRGRTQSRSGKKNFFFSLPL